MAMSCKNSKADSTEPRIVKFGCEDEVHPSSGKPCIDFQPDDRWQIKEDEDSSSNSSEQEKPNSKINDKRRKRKRGKADNLPNSNKKHKNSTAVNGESAETSSSGGDHEHDVEESDSSRKNSVSKKVSDNECNTEKLFDVADIDSDSKPNSSETANEKDTKDKQNKNSSNSKIKVDKTMKNDVVVQDESLSSTGKVERSKRKNSTSSCENDLEGKKLKVCESKNEDADGQESDVVGGSKHDKENDKTDESANVTNVEGDLAPVLQDESVRNDATPDIEECTSTSEDTTSKSRKTMPELSSNENSRSSLKKDDVESSDSREKKSDDSTKHDDHDSDNEIQIISSTSNGHKVYEKEFPENKAMCQEDILLSAGYPFFNSLQEKVKGFKAGEYKPVKFPHTGTLMLSENEVIIESPSLLVPLLIKEADEFPSLETEGDAANSTEQSAAVKNKILFRKNFFQSSVGQFLINLGMSRVMEWYHKDMKRVKLKQSKKAAPDKNITDVIQMHHKKYVEAKEANAAFTFCLRRCQFCDFKSESRIVMEAHYLTPHISSRREFKCNFCIFMTRDPKEISFHFEALHGKKVILEANLLLHECLFCSFQSHLKTKVNIHMNRCGKQFSPSQNQSPPFEFEFPGVTTKPVTIADVIAHRRMLLSCTGKSSGLPNIGQHGSMAADNSLQGAYARKKLASVLNKFSGGPSNYPESPTLVKHLMGPHSKQMPPQNPQNFQLPPGIVLTRPRVRGQQMRQNARFLQPRGIQMSNVPRNALNFPNNITSAASHLASSGISITPVTKPNPLQAARMAQMAKPGMKNITLTPISSAGNQVVSQKPGPPQPVALFTNVAGGEPSRGNRGGVVAIAQPQPARMPLSIAGRSPRLNAPYQRLNTPPSQVVKNSSGNTFVMCEICDSYIKDLEELRSHMNWVHKVKIHPKMLVSRPPLNCQKCQWRFFTDQGLERHLLGAHGLVTTNMQEMANKNQDGGRCIICGAVFTYKLVSHMTQVHKVTLKPAHLSYKCTVCTATFTLYRLFESHVYNVHSGSKRPAEESAAEQPPSKKISIAVEEVTEIVERPATEKKCKECGHVTDKLEDHLIAKHIKKCCIKLCRVEKCEKCLYSSDEMLVIRMSDFGSDFDESEEDSSEEEDESETDDKPKVTIDVAEQAKEEPTEGNKKLPTKLGKDTVPKLKVDKSDTRDTKKESSEVA